MRVIIAITGASGVIMGIKLLEKLGEEKLLIISKNAKKIIESETEYSYSEVIDMANAHYENEEIAVDIASGTNKFDALVIVPCSMNTLSKIACGIADNLTTRVAAVALKERRKIIIVPRETPLNEIALKNMLKLAQMGVIIIPPMPAFYLKPKSVEDIVDYVVGKIMDHLGLKHDLYEPYSP